MYSLLLMSALAGAPDANGFGWRSSGCAGVTSCTGYVSCTGCCGYSSYTSCCGYTSCTGCTGSAPKGHFLGIMDGLRANRAARKAPASTSCCGSCYGSCWGSCYSSCSGCYSSCSGCWGSSCHGSVPAYNMGCWGSSCHGSMPPYTGCTGCTGCSGYIVIGATAGVAPVAGVEAPLVITAGKAPARLAVELPSDAKLYVDGQLIDGTGANRQFNTPNLAAGQAYYYEVKAEILVNGKTEVEEARVVVRAGELSTTRFEKLVAAVSSSRELAAK